MQSNALIFFSRKKKKSDVKKFKKTSGSSSFRIKYVISYFLILASPFPGIMRGNYLIFILIFFFLFFPGAGLRQEDMFPRKWFMKSG